MKMKKLIVCFLISLIMVGCAGTKNGLAKEYDGLEAKQTYEALLDKMNKEATYMCVDITNPGASRYENQSYLKDGIICSVSRHYYDNGEELDINYNVSDGKDIYTLVPGELGNYMLYSYPNEFGVEDKMLRNLYENKMVTVTDIVREDKEKQIVLKIKNNWTNEDGEVNYALNELIIGQDGFLSEENIDYYTDDTYATKKHDGIRSKIYNYNQKKDTYFDKEIEFIKSLDGSSYETLKEKLNIDK